jgi:hypothetical protein
MDMNYDEVVELYEYFDRIMGIGAPTTPKILVNKIKHLYSLLPQENNNESTSNPLQESDYDNMIDVDMFDEVVRLNEP